MRYKTHYSTGDYTACGKLKAKNLSILTTSDKKAVTCETCIKARRL